MLNLAHENKSLLLVFVTTTQKIDYGALFKYRLKHLDHINSSSR